MLKTFPTGFFQNNEKQLQRTWKGIIKNRQKMQAIIALT